MNELLNKWSGTIDSALAVVTAYGLSVIAAFVILILGLWISGGGERLVRRALSGRRYADPTLVNFLSNLVKYLIVALTVIAVLDRFGIETTSLVAVIGAAGLTIGLALQGTLSHIAAGIMLLIFRPFRIDDVIETKDVSGTVLEITLFFTVMRTNEGVRMIVPNGLLWGQWIRNHGAKDSA